MSERFEELSLTITRRIGEIGYIFSQLLWLGKKVGSVDKMFEDLID